jgi:hypothetical protein
VDVGCLSRGWRPPYTTWRMSGNCCGFSISRPPPPVLTSFPTAAVSATDIGGGARPCRPPLAPLPHLQILSPSASAIVAGAPPAAPTPTPGTALVANTSSYPFHAFMRARCHCPYHRRHARTHAPHLVLAAPLQLLQRHTFWIPGSV